MRADDAFGGFRDGVAQECGGFAPTEEQTAALRAIRRWWDALQSGGWTAKRQFVLAGAAGTGKSSLIPLAIRALGLVPEEAKCIAYTGKAALNMRRKGAGGSQTLHSAIYNPVYRKGAVLPVFTLKDSLPYRLVVVDEASMISEELYDDLTAFRKPVLFVGDHCQLPPIEEPGKKPFNLMDEPDFILRKVLRQASEKSPILRAAALVVQGREIPYCDCPAEGFRKIRASRLEDADILAADQIIVRTNKMRQFFNEDCRRLLGRGGKPPAKGDKFVCLRNSSKRDAFNGQFFYAATAPRWNSFEQCWSCVLADELLWNDGRDSLLADAYRYDERDIRGFCLGDAPLLDPKDPRLRLDYGYALTCHKAQGSEWDDVLIYDDGAAPGGEEMRRRWLYTAVTRAKQRLTIVTP